MGNAAGQSSAATATAATPITRLHAVVICHTSAPGRRARARALPRLQPRSPRRRAATPTRAQGPARQLRRASVGRRGGEEAKTRAWRPLPTRHRRPGAFTRRANAPRLPAAGPCHRAPAPRRFAAPPAPPADRENGHAVRPGVTGDRSSTSATRPTRRSGSNSSEAARSRPLHRRAT